MAGLTNIFVVETDVDTSGATYFSHFDLEVQPIKGLTLIWPAEWTHAHQGNLLKKGSKYIITGWLDFPTEDGESIINPTVP